MKTWTDRKRIAPEPKIKITGCSVCGNMTLNENMTCADCANMKQTKPPHTPTLILPLQVINNGAGVKYLCDSSNGVGAGREIATLTHHADGVNNADLKIEDELNAAFIVRACNNYQSMLEALKRIHYVLEKIAVIDWTGNSDLALVKREVYDIVHSLEVNK
jgi:hypothetical protein